MNIAGIWERDTHKKDDLGSLDHSEPVVQMCAVDLVLQKYFESEDWLNVRNKEFPGLQRRHR